MILYQVLGLCELTPSKQIQTVSNYWLKSIFAFAYIWIFMNKNSVSVKSTSVQVIRTVLGCNRSYSNTLRSFNWIHIPLIYNIHDIVYTRRPISSSENNLMYRPGCNKLRTAMSNVSTDTVGYNGACVDAWDSGSQRERLATEAAPPTAVEAEADAVASTAASSNVA